MENNYAKERNQIVVPTEIADDLKNLKKEYNTKLNQIFRLRGMLLTSYFGNWNNTLESTTL